MTSAATYPVIVVLAMGMAVGSSGWGQETAAQSAPVQAPIAARQPPSPAAIAKAAEILAETRVALGGQKLDAVKTLVVSGRTRRVRGNSLVPIEFEISLELPDKYFRKDESPFEESDPTTLGFNGDSLIQLPAPVATTRVAAPAGGRAQPTAEQVAAQVAAQQRARVSSLKQDVTRMVLGLFPTGLATFPLTFSYVAVAEAPQGRADVLEGHGPDGFEVRLFINSETRQPLMASWRLPPTNVIVTAAGQPPPTTVAPGAVVVTGPPLPPPTAPEAERQAYAAEIRKLQDAARATPVEHRLYYADYRLVDGILLPFRFRRAIGADTTEETTVDRYRINTRIAPERFRPVN